MSRICSICKDEFDKKHGNQKYCSEECSKKRRLINKKIWHRNHRREIKRYKKFYYQSVPGIWATLVDSAKQRNIKFSITKEDFINWYNNQEKRCYYCKRILESIKQDSLGHNNRLTIDRKDNNRGYELDNIVLACFRCNSTKSNYFTEQEMLTIGQIIKNKENRG